MRYGINVIALADGAGSANMSHYGAECVTECISEYLINNFTDIINNEDGTLVKINILDAIVERLEATAKDHECEVRDLSSTLLAVAICDNRYLMIHIGDGVIGYLEDNELKVASHPDNGEHSNITTFVTSNNALTSMRIIRGNITGIVGFVLMSDGTCDSLYHKQTETLAKVIIKLLDRTSLLDTAAFTKKLTDTFRSVIAKNTHDDCSIALLARPISNPREYHDLTFDEKCELLGYNPNNHDTRGIVSRVEDLLTFLEVPKDEQSVVEFLMTKPNHVKKKLKRLQEAGLIVKNNDLYSRAI